MPVILEVENLALIYVESVYYTGINRKPVLSAE